MMPFLRMPDGSGVIHLRMTKRAQKKLGPECRACICVADFLCDYPMGEGKTCDAPMCRKHAREVGPDRHYCPWHAEGPR
jgi:hypothetical protein